MRSTMTSRARKHISSTNQRIFRASQRSPGAPLYYARAQVPGGKGSFLPILRDLDTLKGDFFRTHGPYMIQEKIPFKNKYTVGVLCNADSRVRRLCVIKEIRNYPVETGPGCCVETVRYPELEKLSIRLMESLNYYGIADIDFLIDERTGGPVLMEINPRFWGSVQVAINAGVDFPVLL